MPTVPGRRTTPGIAPADDRPIPGESLSNPFLLAKGGLRTLQVQPTLKCNLHCAHCYSESGPEQSGEIPLDHLERFLEQAAELGYGYVGVSGGEPLLWTGLYDFLDFAREIGFSTSVTTNGTLLDAESAAGLRGRARVVAVSVDGPPEEHAKIRSSTTAFPRMLRGLAALRDAGVPFTLTFTLTRYNADRLSWLYEFADNEGARAVEVHPLCDFGAASSNLPDSTPDSREFRVAAWLLAVLAENRGPGGPAIFDAIRRSVVERSCWPLLEPRASLTGAPFSDVVPSLVVEGDGCIVPFIYGFPRRWSLGFVGAEPLARMADVWRREHARPVAGQVQATLRRLAAAEAEYIDLLGEVLNTTAAQQAVS